MLTRPIVELWLGADGRPLDPAVVADLSRDLLSGIAGPLDEARLSSSPAAGRLRDLRVWA
jgi:hypothetical protein